ncbi:hypothetical protein KP509_12G005200 [Ceratopteris richardii]|nr:hypothetical protein KP509_12G005200 [Ceratopteris richardii]
MDMSDRKKGFSFDVSRSISKDSSACSSSIDSGKENVSFNWVQCPVCGKNIKGDDGFINVHVDFCLLESEQKSTKLQSHMRHKRLSLNYSKQQPSVLEDSEKAVENIATCISDSLASDFVDSRECVEQAEIFEKLGMCQSLKESALESQVRESQNEMIIIPVLCNCKCACHHRMDVANSDVETALSEPCSDLNHASDDIVSHQATHNSEKPILPLKAEEVHVLETLIVGRRFNRNVRIEKDMEIQALREPDNPKDGNAIKIIGSSSTGNLTLGHLPRDLAALLACPLDKGILKIKGTVIKVPQKSSEPVPIILYCEGIQGIGIEDSFEETWQSILEAGSTVMHRKIDPHQPPHKYLNNFTYLLRIVLDRDSHLFDGKELDLLESFFSLSEDAKCLFIRLSERKGPWFQVSHINYPEISSVEEAVHELVASGFFTVGDKLDKGLHSEEDLRERMHVLTVPDLRHIVSIANLKRRRADNSPPKRDELLDWIWSAAKDEYLHISSKTCGDSAAVTSLISESLGLCVRISSIASFLNWRVQRLFFLYGEQDLSTFLLVDMGTIKYPSYVCNQTRKTFLTREALLAYEQALEIAQRMDVAVEESDMQSIESCVKQSSLYIRSQETNKTFTNNYVSEDPFLARFSAAWVFATIGTVGVSILERERRYAEAVELLRDLLGQCCCPGRRGYWTTRLSIDLEHLGLKDESLEVAESGLNDSRIRHGDRVALQRRVLRLGKPPRRWKKPSFAKTLSKTCKEVIITGRPLNCQTGMKSRFYGYDDNRCSVEELALQYYAGDAGGAWQGVHSESGIWMTLFALLMWDVIFADVPNVFWHPFQAAPLDLKTDAFCLIRESLIEAQLKRIQGGEAAQILATMWSKYFGTICQGLNWERHSLHELQIMVCCLGGPELATICRLLAEDYAGLSGGMPDLFLWKPLNSEVPCSLCDDGCPNALSSLAGEAKLVEVKGPRDRLSEQQRAWISILMEAGIDVEVCKVKEKPMTSKNDHGS